MVLLSPFFPLSPPSSHLHLTPRPFPSHHHQLHLDHRSSPCRGHGAGWRAGSCTQPGCTGWSTGPAGGVGPGGSRQPAPGPAKGWPRGSPPPAEPRSLRQTTGLSSRGSSRGGGPWEKRRETGVGMIQRQAWEVSLFSSPAPHSHSYTHSPTFTHLEAAQYTHSLTCWPLSSSAGALWPQWNSSHVVYAADLVIKPAALP